MRKYFKPIALWTDSLQNDFASRADWWVKSNDAANHPPVVALGHSNDLNALPGETVKLSAEGTNDPDGNDLKYRWLKYREAGSYDGIVEIRDGGKQSTTFTVPIDAGPGQTVHVVCEVKGNGLPPLTRYQGVVVEIP